MQLEPGASAVTIKSVCVGMGISELVAVYARTKSSHWGHEANISMECTVL